MAKKLLVRTPKTRDGLTPVMTPEGQRVFTHSIVEPWARAELESLNNTRAAHLKHEFEDIDDGGVYERPTFPPRMPDTEGATGHQRGGRGGRNASLI
jgi:hypothetical protein